MKQLYIDTSALSETNRIIVEAIYQERQDELLAADNINLDALLETDEELNKRLENDAEYWRDAWQVQHDELLREKMNHSETANAFIAEMDENAVSEARIADLESMLTDAENELINAHKQLELAERKQEILWEYISDNDVAEIGRAFDRIDVTK